MQSDSFSDGWNRAPDGVSAIDAMVGAAAAMVVAYPHRTGLGGDGFRPADRTGPAPVALRALGVTDPQRVSPGRAGTTGPGFVAAPSMRGAGRSRFQGDVSRA